MPIRKTILRVAAVATLFLSQTAAAGRLCLAEVNQAACGPDCCEKQSHVPKPRPKSSEPGTSCCKQAPARQAAKTEVLVSKESKPDLGTPLEAPDVMQGAAELDIRSSACQVSESEVSVSLQDPPVSTPLLR